MKRALLLTLALCLAASLAACSPAGQDDGSAPPDAVNGDAQIPVPEFTADTLPRIDGSTATIPLSEALAQKLLGLTAEQAQDFVHHNTTHNAYVNLIDGACDLIFVTPPSAEEEALMADSGEEFEVVPVVSDAFVFLVGADNPVESLTVQQLKDIYTGKITNWSEVGGQDLDIIPYQRPDNSGSQTLMYKLLVPASDIAEPPSELVIDAMDGLVDAVSDYETGPAALGYSVYYYAGSMYVSDGSRLLAVDGVLPTDETVESGEYPLTDAYYAVYRKSEAGDSPVRQLLNWLMTEDGQALAQSAGYVPLRIE